MWKNDLSFEGETLSRLASLPAPCFRSPPRVDCDTIVGMEHGNAGRDVEGDLAVIRSVMGGDPELQTNLSRTLPAQAEPDRKFYVDPSPSSTVQDRFLRSGQK